MSNAQQSGSGLSITGLLGIVFVVLKLLHKIDWSWWWVTAPFWGPAALALAFCVCLFVVWALTAPFLRLSRRRRRRRAALAGSIRRHPAGRRLQG